MRRRTRKAVRRLRDMGIQVVKARKLKGRWHHEAFPRAVRGLKAGET